MPASPELTAFVKQIESLSPGDKLRLAASLLDAREPAKLRLAVTIAESVTTEARAALLMLDMKARAK